MKVTVKFEGGRELDAALSQFTPTKRRSIGRVALDAGGQILARSMRDKAPVESGDNAIIGDIKYIHAYGHQSLSEDVHIITYLDRGV